MCSRRRRPGSRAPGRPRWPTTPATSPPPPSARESAAARGLLRRRPGRRHEQRRADRRRLQSGRRDRRRWRQRQPRRIPGRLLDPERRGEVEATFLAVDQRELASLSIGPVTDADRRPNDAAGHERRGDVAGRHARSSSASRPTGPTAATTTATPTACPCSCPRGPATPPETTIRSGPPPTTADRTATVIALDAKPWFYATSAPEVSSADVRRLTVSALCRAFWRSGGPSLLMQALRIRCCLARSSRTYRAARSLFAKRVHGRLGCARLRVVRSRRVSDRAAGARSRPKAGVWRPALRPQCRTLAIGAEILAARPEQVVGGCRARLRSARRGGGCRLCADPVEDGRVALVVDAACFGVGGLEQAE